MNDTDTVDGFDAAVFREVAQIAGWSTAYQLDNWELIQQKLMAGAVDIVPMFISEERRERYLFSSPITVEYHLLYGIETEANYTSLEFQSGYRIAAEAGGFALSELSKLNQDITLIGTASEVEALQMVARGEADLAFLPAHVARYSIRTENLTSIVAISPPMLPVEYAFAINPRRPDLLEQTNNALSTMQRAGIIQQLKQQWLAPDNIVVPGLFSTFQHWTTLTMALLTGLAAVGTWNYRSRLSQATLAGIAQNRLLRSTNRKIRSLIHRDALTGLPNRQSFTAEIKRRISLAQKNDKKLGIGILTIRDLEYIQHTVGDSAGDQFIKNVAKILEDVKTNLDHLFVSYPGPGQFGFIFDDAANSKNVTKNMLGIIDLITQDIELDGMKVFVQTCAGVALYPDHADTEFDLLHKTKLAMNNALKSGSQILCYQAIMKPDPQKLWMMTDLKESLKNGTMNWALQPQYDVKEKKTNGAEILIRWQHPVHGWIPPSDFIVWAEQTGDIRNISLAAVKQATQYLKYWKHTNENYRLSVNMSANDLADKSMVDFIIEHTESIGKSLTLEITETALIQDMKLILANVEKLKDVNIQISLDDYGTGYSSMEYLKVFNFDELKIDQTFIKNIKSNERNLQLTQASIKLGHSLHAKVVAEGVEDQETAKILIDMGCDILQGYHIARPMIIDNLDDFMRTNTSITI